MTELTLEQHEDAVFREILLEIGPQVVAEYIISHGNPGIDEMWYIGHLIEERVKARGLPEFWFIKYALRRKEALENQARAANAERMKAAQAAEDARRNPYKCPACERRFPTTDKRRDHAATHKATV